MFFFFFDFNNHVILKDCLDKYLKTNFQDKNYCDIAELFSDKLKKTEVLKLMPIYSDRIEKLYKHKYPNDDTDLYIVNELYNNLTYIDSHEAFLILFWCFKIFKHKKKPFEKYKTEIMTKLMDFLQDKLGYDYYKNYDSIIYDTRNVEIFQVESTNDFLNILPQLKNEEHLFFRGQSKTTYNLKPSIFRSENLIKNEHRIYQELLINCPEDFKNCKHHIDYLVKMQHYGLPTRLLDVTRNPLVALYFACCNNLDSIGEIIVFSPKHEQIKYENSDTIAMLSTLPLFSYEDQGALIDSLYIKQNNNDNIVERFVHEMQAEKPGFIDKIQVNDLTNCFMVLTKKDNNRIIKQDGAFILCGNHDNPEQIINQSLRLCKENKPVLIFISNKKAILEELDLLSINKSSLFPEIDCVSDYIRSKYCK